MNRRIFVRKSVLGAGSLAAAGPFVQAASPSIMPESKRPPVGKRLFQSTAVEEEIITFFARHKNHLKI